MVVGYFYSTCIRLQCGILSYRFRLERKGWNLFNNLRHCCLSPEKSTVTYFTVPKESRWISDRVISDYFLPSIVISRTVILKEVIRNIGTASAIGMMNAVITIVMYRTVSDIRRCFGHEA